VSAELSAFLQSWSLEPQIVLGLLIAAGLYAVGWWRYTRKSRGKPPLPPWRAVCYALGLIAVGLALLSPISVYSSLLFSMHMTQHLLMMIVAAPLIWLGAPLLPSLWALPRAWRRAIGALFVPGNPVQRLFHYLTVPVVAVTIYLVTIAVWHIPAFYDAAQGRSVVHDLEHLMFFGAALLYWWPVVHPAGGRRRLSYGAGIFYLFPALLEGNLIGALITFAGEPLYETYRLAPRVWGLSAVQDQQIGGLLMWVLGGLLLLLPIFVLVYKLVGGDDSDEQPRQRASLARSLK
jgi:cytochrome c oxidase assembly factor CtaG